ncbi:histidine--tRNA ligase [archaeon]|nr:histidine--tRNA ligase [archaeon]
MENARTENVKGFRDFTGEEARKRSIIKGIIVKNFERYGFEPAETPIVEYEEFVKGDNIQDEIISDIFKLQDKGKRNLALRYEFTFQLKRIAKNKKLPYKRYQIGEVFRDEPVSADRFRQFTQCDADVIVPTIKDEAEVLALFRDILKELKIEAVINISNRKLMDEILEKEGVREDGREEVMRIIDKIDKMPEKEIREGLKRYNAERVLEIFKEDEKYFERFENYKSIKELKEYCAMFGFSINFQPNLARGLSYYNGSVFEIKTKAKKESIAGGGSYLVNGIQGTGISFGLERLYSLAKINASEKRIAVISIGQDEEAIGLAGELRKNGIQCVLFYGRPSKALEYANSCKLPFAVFVGEEEIKKKNFKLKDMKTGKEQLLTIKEIIVRLSKV